MLNKVYFRFSLQLCTFFFYNPLRILRAIVTDLLASSWKFPVIFLRYSIEIFLTDFDKNSQ